MSANKRRGKYEFKRLLLPNRTPGRKSGTRIVFKCGDVERYYSFPLVKIRVRRGWWGETVRGDLKLTTASEICRLPVTSVNSDLCVTVRLVKVKNLRFNAVLFLYDIYSLSKLLILDLWCIYLTSSLSIYTLHWELLRITLKTLTNFLWNFRKGLADFIKRIKNYYYNNNSFLARSHG